MNRLTVRINGKLTLTKQFPTLQDTLDVVAERLELYEDLEEQGLLIKSPCRVGDIVWCIDDTGEDLPWSIEFDYYMIDQIGKSIFLTREEAEKALEEK